jgi:azurin
MKSMTRRHVLGLLGGTGLVAGFMTACGGGSAAPAANNSSSAPAAPAAPAAGSGGDVSLSLGSKGATPFFDTELLEAKSGSKITLTFTNNADTNSGKRYNWVLVKPGMTLNVVSEGQSQGTPETSYVKPNDPNVITFTKLLDAGQSDTITFDAPAPGDYPYFSTFPGLYNTMKGVLRIA